MGQNSLVDAPVGTEFLIEVRVPTLLRPATGGKAAVSASGDNVGEVLRSLESANPGLAGQLLTAEGQLHKFVNVYLNDDDVRYLDRLATKVVPGDVISILPAVAGGAA